MFERRRPALHGGLVLALAAFALAELANLGCLIRRHVIGWRGDLAHGDAASQVRNVGVIDSNDEGRSRGGGFLRRAATNKMLRKTVIHVVRQAGDEAAETDAIQHTDHRFEHSDAHYGGAYN